MSNRTFFYGIWLMLALLFVAQCSRNNLEMVETPRPTAAPRVTESSAPEPNTLAPKTALAPATNAPTDAPATVPATNAPTDAPATTPAQNAPMDAPPDVIRRALLAQLSAPRERSLTKITNADGTVTEMLYEYIAPGSIHVRTDEMEIIAIQGKGAWQKNEGSWESVPETIAQPFLRARDPKAIEPILEMIVWSDAKFAGAEVWNGKPVWRYTYNTLIKGMGVNGGDVRGENQLWVGALDGLPYRVLSVTDSIMEQGTRDTTEQTHEYDAVFVIEPPQ